MTREVKRFPSGIIQMPPSKYVSHRVLICAGLCEGRSILRGVSVSEDAKATIACMEALGARFTDVTTPALRATPPGEGNYGVTAVDGAYPRADGRTLDCGESGSTLRFLIPVAALSGDEAMFTGRGRLMERPLEPYVEALGRNGVSLEPVREPAGGRLRIRGKLRPGIFSLDGGISSQFVSGLLFALPLLDGDSVIRVTSPLESAPYVDMTLEALARFGIHAENNGYKEFLVKGGQKYRPADCRIEADFAQAAFFLAAGALGADCECAGLDCTGTPARSAKAPDSPIPGQSARGDKRILDILRECGIKIIVRDNGNIKALPGKIRGVTVDVSDIPDLAPPLAALLCFCEGTSRLVNAGRLRLKESDRLTALATELGKLGADITENPDGLVIKGVKSLKGCTVSGCNDHRIAMALAVAAIRADGPVFIEGSECVGKSHPGFWEDFEGPQANRRRLP